MPAGPSMAQTVSCSDGEEEVDPNTRMEITEEIDADGGLEIVLLNQKVQSSVRAAVTAFDPCWKGNFFQDARHLGPWVKKQLPSKDRCTELRENVQAVQNECNKFSDFVVDFVRTVGEATGKVQSLSTDVNQLTQKGCQEINRVENGATAWDPAVLKPQIASMKRRFEDVKHFVNGEANEVKSTLGSHRGEAIVALIDEINGAGPNDVRAEIVMSLAEDASELMRHKRQKNKQEVTVKFLMAERERCDLGLKRIDEDLKKAEAALEESVRAKAACESKQAESLQEIQNDLNRQTADLCAREGEALGTPLCDNQLSKLQQQSDAAIEEAAKITAELDLAKIQPDPPMHFLFVLEKSPAMRGRNWTNLRTAIQTMARRRQQLPLRTKDKVSVVLYCREAWTAVFNKSWADVVSCEEMSDRKFGGYTSWWGAPPLAPAFKEAQEVAQKVQPVEDNRLKTQIVFATAQGPADSAARDDERAAQAFYDECSKSGPANCFVLLFGGSALEMSMNTLVKALNNGQTSFNDDQGGSREFYSLATDPDEIQKKFDLLTRFWSSEILAAELKFKYANDKQEKLSFLTRRREEELMKRKSSLLKRVAEEETRMREASDARRQSDTQRWDARAQVLEEIADGHRETVSKLQQTKEAQLGQQRELFEQLKNAEDTLESLAAMYEKVKNATEDEGYVRKSKEQLEKARAKYGSLNPEQLINVLNFVKQKMDDARIIFDGILHSFEMTCLPVENMIIQLEQSCEVDFTPYTAERKIVDCYRLRGLSALDKTNFKATDNWQTIVSFHHPRASARDLELFMKALHLGDFVSLCLEQPGKGRESAKRKLQKKLKSSLELELETTSGGKSAVKRVRMGTKRKERVKQEIEQTQETIQQLSEEADDVSTPEPKRRRKEAASEDKQRKLEEKEKELEKIEEELEEGQDELDENLTTEFPDMMPMFDSVYNGVLNVFGQVMLSKGLDMTRWGLRSLDALFTDCIQPFCLESARVRHEFLSSAQGGRMTLAWNDQPGSSQKCLLEEFKFVA
mmetsp:Transcript_89655/g.178253  ORF Transcript_89655/g.178253 Transcript_89655/m.178253 type:complete len:1028 (+) Transcript_89655:63-3146(+)|eukprot:CAMPEP_0172709632 /NCGR_PEP_ID=MMETSP1074-20121228/55176_1 /TAXON_ID=2916 /ORGANISM="Ceratium fusus, Strain PA161109" /LENGTH=1027 /DNA_ID=CAMNT_0013532917 /DNA_START=58 /DNA_END=3141 /DNA_ORIENTATION=+